MSLKGLTVDAYGVASLAYLSAVPPRPVISAQSLPEGKLRVVNETSATLAGTVVVVTGGARADVGRLLPGQSRDVQPVRASTIDPPDSRRRKLDDVLYWVTRSYVPPGHSLVACEVESPAAGEVTTEPALPIRVEDVRLTLGPLREARR
jgi:hypothetical protein